MSQLTNGLLVSLLLSASSVAVADSKYPAADFQPKVLYQNPDYDYAGSSSTETREVSVADPNYPAANFQPEILYQDTGYKHKKDKTTTASSGVASSSNDNEAQANEESSMSLILGLAIIAIAGFVFYSKGIKRVAPVKKRRAASAPVVKANQDMEGLSGVARYVTNKVGPVASGVAKYLQERESVAVSGVAKYVAQQKISDRLATAAKISGVDKYLKDRS